MNLNATDQEGFMKTVIHSFNKHAPIKTLLLKRGTRSNEK